jgi:hypothetical protein
VFHYYLNIKFVHGTKHLVKLFAPEKRRLFPAANFIGGGTEKILIAGLEQVMRYNLTSKYFSGKPLCGEAMRHERYKCFPGHKISPIRRSLGVW